MLNLNTGWTPTYGKWEPIAHNHAKMIPKQEETSNQVQDIPLVLEANTT